MKIIETYYPADISYGEKDQLLTEIVTESGKMSTKFGAGETKDFYLSRALKDAYNISKMLEMAYNAGKNGEELEIIKQTIEEDD